MRTSDASRPVSAPEPPGQEVPQNPYVYFEREDWCSLCDCTISNLEQHRNNRVHLVNDLIWETQRKFSGRVWSPAKVFARSPLRSAWEAASHRSGPSTPSWNEFIAAHARLLPLGDPRRRLMILRGMLLLQEVGILRLFEYDSWRFREGSIAYNRGHRALKWLLSLSIHGLFPNGSSGVHSNFLSNCYGSRILADVYDLLQLQSLLPHARVLSNLCLDGTYNDETKKAIVKVTLGELFYLGSPDRNRSQLFQYQYPTSHWKNTNSFLSKDGRGRNTPLSRFDGIPSWIQHLANWLSHSLLTEIMFLRFSKAASVTQKLWWERNLLTETHHSINKGQSSAQMLDDSSTEVNILRNYFYDRLHVKES